MPVALLVGRARERAAVDRAIEAVKAGRGRALAFIGPPGIGKSSLLDDLVARCSSRGLASAWGVAWDGTGAPVFWPLIQALRSLAASAPVTAAVAAQMSALADELSSTTRAQRSARAARASQASVPRAHGRLESPNARADGHDPDDLRARIFDRTVTALIALGRPTALVLDDLHAADAATLELLSFCLRATRGAPILWALSWRNAELGDRSPAVLRALAELSRDVDTLELEPLSAEEIAALAKAEASRPLAPRALEALHARTLGNPLFIVEILRHQDAERALPESVRHAWTSRIERFDPAVREVIEAAAILGDELRLPALAALIRARPEETLARLTEPVRAGLLVDDGGTRLRFGHPLMRETVLALLPLAARAELHRRAAETLSALSKSGSDVRASAIAHHLLEARPIARVEELVWAVREAAGEATRLGADEDAADLLRRTVDALETARAAPPVLLDALIFLAEASLRAGRREEGISASDRAIHLARNAGDPEAFARAALARGLELQVAIVDRALIEVLEEALDRLPPDPSPSRARVLARLAAARQPAKDRFEPVRMAYEAVAMADAVAGPIDLAVVLFNAGSALAEVEHPRERAPLDERCFRASSEIGERAFAIRAATRLVMDHLELGDVAAATRWADDLSRLVEEVPRSRWRWLPLAVAAMLAHLRGEIRAALRLNETLEEVAREIPDPWARRVAFIQRLGLIRDGGTSADLEALGPVAAGADIKALQNQYIGRLSEAAVRAALGQNEHARSLLESAGIDAETPVEISPGLLVHSAQCFASLGLADPARAMMPRAERCERDWATWGFLGFFFDGPTERARGLLRLAAGQPDQAATSLARAEQECRRRGMRAAAVRCGLDRARALAAAGRTAEASSALEDARREAVEIGMTLILGELPRAPAWSLEPSGEGWKLEHEGRVHFLRDQKGLQMLATLIARPDEELHALELIGGARSDDTPIDAGDAGELLDETARRRYRQRVVELERAIEDAERASDTGERERLLEERDAIARELSRAVGLGGRARRSGAAAERARVNVQRRLKDAIRRIAEVEPELGEILEVSVATGVFCSYRPRARRRSG